MPDINVNVENQQNVISASVGVYPVIKVDVAKPDNTVSVTVENTTPVIDVSVIATGPVGPPGADGQDGAPGADGFSPVVAVSAITGGHEVSITDAVQTQTFNVMDGADGADGEDGAPGQNGQDGVSPVVSISTITHGHRVTITDADHPTGQSFDVMDGQDGQGAVDSVNGKTGAVVLDANDVGALPDDTAIPTKVSDLTNDSGFITGYTETDPTVPSWAKQASKPSYTASEVGALPDTTAIPSKTSDLVNDSGFITSAPVTSVDGKTGAVSVLPSGGNAGQLLAKNSATDYDVHWVNKTQDYPSAYCTTAAATAAKKASCSLWVDTANSYLHVLIGQANTSAGAITLNVNSTGAKPVYINGAASSATNYTLPAGSYIAFYDGTNYYFRTDGKLTANITGNAANGGVTSVNGQTGTVVLDADDVGALPDTTVIPTNVSDLVNDSGFITGYTETDPTVSAWAKAASKPSYTASEVGAIASPSSPTSGDFLVYNGSAWVAMSLSAWQGGNY